MTLAFGHAYTNPRTLPLVVYRVAEGSTEVTEYDRDHYEEALDAYRGAERTHRDETGVGVVLLSADSRESLMATNGRFFEESRRHVDDYITERLDEMLGEVERNACVIASRRACRRRPWKRRGSLRGRYRVTSRVNSNDEGAVSAAEIMIRSRSINPR